MVIYKCKERGKKMKTYELHVSVSYTPAGTTYHNCFKEYIEANSEKEAKKKLKEMLKDDGYDTIRVTEICEC